MVQTTEMENMTQSKIESLETAYIEAAAELQSKQANLANYAAELDAFIAARDALREHPEFSGKLPKTYFSGGDLDPDGSDDTETDSQRG
jgi:hypothetical protein